MTHAPKPMDATAWAMLLALSLLWGSSFLFFGLLGAAYPPLVVVLGRVGLAALALHLVLVRRGTPAGRGLPWGGLAVMGLLNNVIPFLLIAYGVTRIPTGQAAILNATTPIFAVLLAHAAGRERLVWNRGAGVAAGFLGVCVLAGPAALAGTGDLVGQLACLGAACSYALAGLYGTRFRDLPPLQVATGQVSASAVLVLPSALLLHPLATLPMPTPADWAAFAGIALLCTAAAYILYFTILARAGATNLLLVTFLLPVSALALGAVVLGETVTAQALAGMALIGLGLAAIDGRLLPRPRAA